MVGRRWVLARMTAGGGTGKLKVMVPAAQHARLRREQTLIAAVGLAGLLLFVGGGLLRGTWQPEFPTFPLVGLTYLGSAAVLRVRRPDNPIGWLLVLVGALHFVRAANMYAGLPWVAAAGRVLWDGELAVMLHLAMAMPGGRLRTRAARGLVAAFYVVVLPVDAAVGFAVGQLPPPPTDLSPAGAVAVALVRVTAGAIFVGASLTLVRRVLDANVATRRAIAPVVVAVVVKGLLVGLDGSGIAVPGLVQVAATVAMPLTAAWGLLRVRWRRAAVGDLVVALDQGLTGPELRSHLARCLGDPTLRLAFPDARGYVDESGQPIEPGRHGRSTTTVDGPSGSIAVLEHTDVLDEEPELLQAAAAASRLALDNARLQATLRSSRARLVSAVDAERRRLERDLHDGAQQSLLAAATALGRRQLTARSRGDEELAARLRQTADMLDVAIEELRTLTRGVHLQVLSERGLSVALETLAQRAPLPVDVDVDVPDIALPVATTAYYVAAEALTNAGRHADATQASITADLADGELRVEVQDDGRGGAQPAAGRGLQNLQDRAAAFGGTVLIDSPPGRGTVVRLRVPVTGPS